MPDDLKIQTPVQLLVEGNDSLNFFQAMIGQLSLEKIQIQNFGGVKQLRPFLVQFVTSRNFEAVRRVGIVRDAEESLTSARQSIHSAIERAGLSLPDELGLLSTGDPAVIVMILPNNQDDGMLETALCRTFASTEIDGCIDSYFECVQGQPGVEFKRHEKARSRAWLATRPDPHLSVGVAAKRGYWDLGHEALSEVRDFLKTLSDVGP